MNHRFAFVVAALVFVACSGGSSTSDGGSGSSSGTGGDTGAGMGSSSSSGSGGSSGSSGSGSGGSSSGCTTASDCPGQACCASIPITGGALPRCTTGTVTATCKAAVSCPTTLGLSCSGTEQVQLCTTANDCKSAGTGNDLCCTFTNDSGSLSFCASQLIGNLANGKCM